MPWSSSLLVTQLWLELGSKKRWGEDLLVTFVILVVVVV
jgi:hypothetical protein